MDKDGYISNGELFQVLKMMVGNNLKDTQLQQIVDKTIINADKDGDGRISFEEFCAVSWPSGGILVWWHFCWCSLLWWSQMSKGQKTLETQQLFARSMRFHVMLSV